ncbi:hypothetical protein [Fodinicola feengrottensis]|uniref:Tetratricopeptide repeat protein n=1 Tax=Fodinicola feengrottensis TaxID=435914 RepID=A0ABN2G2G1_9ACTN|nr:hypothetical protein [Fodinicola feengrottensis]
MTNAEGVADPRLEAEGELCMARIALDEGDRQHAADHVARALVCAPTLPEAHELLATLGDLDLFSTEQPAYLGTVVARAHMLAAHGQATEALNLLVSAQCHDPDGHWAAVPWVLDPALAAHLDPDDLSGWVGRLLGVMADPVGADRRAPFQPYLQLITAALGAHPSAAALFVSASMFVRRMGDPVRAADLALRSEQLRPSFHAALALGYAYRAQQRIADAEQAWLRALSYDPGNLALFTDIGELLEGDGRAEEGLAWVERALEQDPDDESAFPTACGMRFRRDDDPAHLVALADYVAAHPDNGHADNVLQQGARTRYWLGPIPAASEAVVDVLAQVIEKEGAGDDGGSLTLTLSAPEPPSALLACERALPHFTITITDRPEPDAWLPVPQFHPQVPQAAMDYLVWRPDGKPAVRPPSENALEALESLAGWRWRHLPAAFDDAVRLASLPLTDLLGVLVHPPTAPDPTQWPEWIRAVQAWACLGIAHHDADQPWRESTRRAVLIDLAFGPEDWVTEAALFALIATAWVDADVREDVANLVAWRFIAALDASKTRPVTISGSLAQLVLITPLAEPSIVDLARTHLSAD